MFLVVICEVCKISPNPFRSAFKKNAFLGFMSLPVTQWVMVATPDVAQKEAFRACLKLSDKQAPLPKNSAH